MNNLPTFYQRYLDRVDETSLVQALMFNADETLELIRSIPEQSADYKYAEGKWTIKQVINHVIDTERVFAYRALRFARNDYTELPGFDENAWADDADVSSITLHRLSEQFANQRVSSVDLFTSFDDQLLSRSGLASGHQMSVEILGKLIVGHTRHHLHILEERYLS